VTAATGNSHRRWARTYGARQIALEPAVEL